MVPQFTRRWGRPSGSHAHSPKAAGAAYNATLITSPATALWGPTPVGPLGAGHMAQRALGHVHSLAAPVPNAGPVEVKTYQPAHMTTPLAIDDAVQIRQDVPDYGGAICKIVHFDCTTELPIGLLVPDGYAGYRGPHVAYFAASEVERPGASDTLVLDAAALADLVADDRPLMGGVR